MVPSTTGIMQSLNRGMQTLNFEISCQLMWLRFPQKSEEFFSFREHGTPIPEHRAQTPEPANRYNYPSSKNCRPRAIISIGHRSFNEEHT